MLRPYTTDANPDTSRAPAREPPAREPRPAQPAHDIRISTQQLPQEPRAVVLGHREHRSFVDRSEEHTSELQSQSNLVCRLLLEKKKKRDSHALKQKGVRIDLKVQSPYGNSFYSNRKEIRQETILYRP